MSLKITRDGVRGLYIIEPELPGMDNPWLPPGVSIEPVTTDNLMELAAAIAHYFRPKGDTLHDIYKRRGLCPLCNAIEEEAKRSKLCVKCGDVEVDEEDNVITFVGDEGEDVTGRVCPGCFYEMEDRKSA